MRCTQRLSGIKEDRPKEWLTVEEPLDLPKVLAEHEVELRRDCG